MTNAAVQVLPGLRQPARAARAEDHRAEAAGLHQRGVRVRLLSRSEDRGRRRSSASNDGRQIVLVKRAIEPGYGKWVFPGGYVDRGEEITLAAIREAREEAGLDVRLDHLVNIYSYAGRAPVIVVYAATMISGELAVDDEGLEAREFDLDEIPWDDLAFRSTREALRDYIDGASRAVR